MVELCLALLFELGLALLFEFQLAALVGLLVEALELSLELFGSHLGKRRGGGGLIVGSL